MGSKIMCSVDYNCCWKLGILGSDINPPSSRKATSYHEKVFWLFWSIRIKITNLLHVRGAKAANGSYLEFLKSWNCQPFFAIFKHLDACVLVAVASKLVISTFCECIHQNVQSVSNLQILYFYHTKWSSNLVQITFILMSPTIVLKTNFCVTARSWLSKTSWKDVPILVITLTKHSC